MTSYEPPAPVTLAWVSAQLGTSVVACRRLVGGITAQMDLISMTIGNDVVLRRWTDPDEPADELVTSEVAALRTVDGVISAPQLLAYDPSGQAAGIPCTLTTALEGAVDLIPRDVGDWLEQLAQMHATIHSVASTLARRRPEPPPLGAEWIVDAGLACDALAAVAAPTSQPDVLVHGDYQHFDVLWVSGLFADEGVDRGALVPG